jgi:hypothetical protein
MVQRLGSADSGDEVGLEIAAFDVPKTQNHVAGNAEAGIDLQPPWDEGVELDALGAQCEQCLPGRC